MPLWSLHKNAWTNNQTNCTLSALQMSKHIEPQICKNCTDEYQNTDELLCVTWSYTPAQSTIIIFIHTSTYLFAYTSNCPSVLTIIFMHTHICVFMLSSNYISMYCWTGACLYFNGSAVYIIIMDPYWCIFSTFYTCESLNTKHWITSKFVQLPLVFECDEFGLVF